MSTSLNAALARLRAAIAQLDKASVTAIRAEADARQAHTHYTEAGQGTDHPKIKTAIAESRTASEKAAKVGRLISEAIGHVTTYANIIAPGSIPTTRASESATPSGEQLMAEAVQRQSSRRNVGAFLGTVTRRTEDLQDNTQKAVAAVRKATEIVRGPDGPTGSVKPGTRVPTLTSAVDPGPKIDSPEGVGHLVVVSLVAGVTIHRSYQAIRKGMSRLRTHERTDRAERPDPGDGSA